MEKKQSKPDQLSQCEDEWGDIKYVVFGRAVSQPGAFSADQSGCVILCAGHSWKSLKYLAFPGEPAGRMGGGGRCRRCFWSWLLRGSPDVISGEKSCLQAGSYQG